MARLHVVDEAVIAATPQEITDAFADEALGRSSWWMPNVQMRSRAGRRPEEVGTIIEYRVGTKGR